MPAALKKCDAGALEDAACRSLTKPQGFVVKRKTGRLRDGEVERARKWDAQLPAAIGAAG